MYKRITCMYPQHWLPQNLFRQQLLPFSDGFYELVHLLGLTLVLATISLWSSLLVLLFGPTTSATSSRGSSGTTARTSAICSRRSSRCFPDCSLRIIEKAWQLSQRSNNESQSLEQDWGWAQSKEDMTQFWKEEIQNRRRENERKESSGRVYDSSLPGGYVDVDMFVLGCMVVDE